MEKLKPPDVVGKIEFLRLAPALPPLEICSARVVGWICPCCDHGVAPHVEVCPCGSLEK